MILSPIDPEKLETTLALFAQALSHDPIALAAFSRIGATRAIDAGAANQTAFIKFHADAVALAETFGMRPLAEPPQDHLSWDGTRVRTLSEAAVLLHEVAHFQLASRERRFLPDFGMGAGPESGAIHVANAAQRLYGTGFEAEEQMTSLLGILWEVELGQPAIYAFQEQNWLEGAGRASTAQFFQTVLGRLIATGLVGGDGRPRLAVNCRSDDPCSAALPGTRAT